MLERLQSRVRWVIVGAAALLVAAATSTPAPADHAAAHAPVPSLEALLTGASTSTAGDPIYMKVPNITGDVTADSFAGFIELNSFQWNVATNATAGHTGSGAGNATKPTFSTISITKQTDDTTPKLFLDTAAGTVLGTVTIDFVQAGVDTGPRVYFKVVLAGAVLTSFSQASGGDRPSENLSLAFSQIQLTYVPISDGGAVGQPIVSCWNLVTQSQLCTIKPQ